LIYGSLLSPGFVDVPDDVSVVGWVTRISSNGRARSIKSSLVTARFWYVEVALMAKRKEQMK
jgi:hypothetical protein